EIKASIQPHWQREGQPAVSFDTWKRREKVTGDGKKRGKLVAVSSLRGDVFAVEVRYVSAVTGHIRFAQQLLMLLEGQLLKWDIVSESTLFFCGKQHVRGE
ncbi:hypothetical protein AVEN_94139-1, partial [Araneus ventricosus]